ncbi:hypothetical protein M3P21_17040 [Ruegeria sp. 2012CJ41-6]|uniref:VPEID-CTERM protein sorting domain protein n=1 Tax=Ruegeria spongiae TaxID=2942209 RepID=A0ABT0Q6P6_9RHOB|nr:hypothetical protein [Ruegeria spongiae]MCL6285237.1 hypothetical protein [Ruegeria spongiae]
MKKILIGASATMATLAALPAYACTGLGCPPPRQVPEISALEGGAAIAALAAVVLIAWERRRRAA